MSRDRSHEDPFDDLQDAMDLWREDAQRAAEGIDIHGDLADRVVADALRRPQLVSEAPAGALWYAAAAVLLIGVGIVGTLAVRQAAPARGDAPRWSNLDKAMIEKITQESGLEPSLGR